MITSSENVRMGRAPRHTTRAVRVRQSRLKSSVGARMDCRGCPFVYTCIARSGLTDTSASPQIDGKHCEYRSGDLVVERGERLLDMLMVRKGSAKSCIGARDGREQVTCFHFAGELIGLDAIYEGSHPGEIVAMEDSEFCRLSFNQLMELAKRTPSIQSQLLRLMSRQLNRASQLTGDLSADERVALFLLDIKARLADTSREGRTIHLVMSRTDMANHLRLAAETISRVLTRFRRHGWINLSGRTLKSMNVEALERLRMGAPAVD
ncbi:helix-turn-helix domain-containing protein [Dyella sp. C11]|uniref:Crp/Fnr family transcriptional regulator n=1 Tax=Dyella sp. C11 TaxID=2126991 RepID=UPI000D6597DA|nr:helix-turn-helix domain-containing protein [Dyella sp. C11]